MRGLRLLYARIVSQMVWLTYTGINHERILRWYVDQGVIFYFSRWSLLVSQTSSSSKPSSAFNLISLSPTQRPHGIPQTSTSCEASLLVVMLWSNNLIMLVEFKSRVVRNGVPSAGVFRLPGQALVGSSELSWRYCLVYGNLNCFWL